MKKIKLNAKDQTNTGSKHAITPVRRSVRITSNGEEDFVSQSALLEEVDFVFQPNKHLENTYFSDSQKSKKKCFKFRLKMEATEEERLGQRKQVLVSECYQFTIKTNMKE